MIRLNPAPTLTRLFLSLTAALLLYSAGAFASDQGGDAQAQARALLSGKPAGLTGTIPKSATVPESRNDRSAFDPQAQARRSILGDSRGAVESADGREVRPASPASDAQEQARELLAPAKVNRPITIASNVALTQSPLVMRMSKDEFRIAFGIMSVGGTPAGCHGQVRYRVNWKAEDGSTRWETREVAYAMAPHTARTIAVDRQYFDTSEGAHTTEVVQVSVDEIVCHGEY